MDGAESFRISEGVGRGYPRTRAAMMHFADRERHPDRHATDSFSGRGVVVQ